MRSPWYAAKALARSRFLWIRRETISSVVNDGVADTFNGWAVAPSEKP